MTTHSLPAAPAAQADLQAGPVARAARRWPTRLLTADAARRAGAALPAGPRASARPARSCRSPRPCRPRCCSATTSTSRRSPTRCCGTRETLADAADRRARRSAATSLVVEIASNDGYLLAVLPRGGRPGARHRAGAERRRGRRASAASRRSCEFFGARPGRRGSRAEGSRADVIHANNVLAHVADLNGFVAGIAHRCSPTTASRSIEVPYVKDLIDRCEFDTIYHEHLCYFSLTALDALFGRHGLRGRGRRADPRSTAARCGSSCSAAATGRRPPAVASLCWRRRPAGASREPAPYAAFAGASRVARASSSRLLDGAEGRRSAGSPPTAPRPRGARCSTSSGSARRRSTSSSTAARTSRGATCPACTCRIDPPGRAARGDARLRAAAHLELRRRDPRPAGRVPATRRPLHRARARTGGGRRDRRRQGHPAQAHPRRARHGDAHAQAHRSALHRGFGEIYFSTVYRGVVKGWHRHREMTLNYACIHGRIKLVLYDDREGSPTARRDHGALPRPGRLQPGGRPTGGLERLQGHERSVRDRRQLLHPPTRPRAQRAARPDSRTTSRTTGPSGSTDRCACW